MHLDKTIVNWMFQCGNVLIILGAWLPRCKENYFEIPYWNTKIIAQTVKPKYFSITIFFLMNFMNDWSYHKLSLVPFLLGLACTHAYTCELRWSAQSSRLTRQKPWGPEQLLYVKMRHSSRLIKATAIFTTAMSTNRQSCFFFF